MTYSTYYKQIFASVRNSLYVKLTDYADFLTICESSNFHCSWAYISIVAEALTAYNELCPFNIFIRIKHFKPNN